MITNFGSLKDFMSTKKLKASISDAIQNDSIVSGLSAAELNQNNIATILDALTVGKSIIHIDEDLVETLGRSGVTVKNACALLHKSFQYFDENPTMQEAFNRGRANLGSRVRSKLIEAAFDGNIQSAIHLDKIYSGETVTEVNITVGQSQLSTVSDEELMKVAFTVDDADIVEDHSERNGDDTLSGAQ